LRYVANHAADGSIILKVNRHFISLGERFLMKLYSWNVNGIRAVLKKGLFQPFLKKHQPDILCLQETKAERGQIEIDLPGYHEYWNSAVKKGYSGTAIFSKQKPLAVINGFPDDFAGRFAFADELKRDSAEEGRVMTAEFEKFYAVTVYTPNAKDDLSRLPLRFKSLGSCVPGLLPAARPAQARDLLRRPQRRAHRTGSGQP
jgi:exodeoxyribonuclease III